MKTILLSVFAAMLVTPSSGFHQPAIGSSTHPFHKQSFNSVFKSRTSDTGCFAVVQEDAPLLEPMTTSRRSSSSSTHHDHGTTDQTYNTASAMFIAASATVLLSSTPAMAAVTDGSDTMMTTSAALLLDTATTTTSSTTTLQLAATTMIGSAALAWLHFLGIMGVAGGLVTERLVIKTNMTVDEENIINGADLIYGLSALSLLVTGYFRVTSTTFAAAKGWDYYKNEPIFWLKMSPVAILGALSFFPALVFFQRDMLRKKGNTLPPLSDALVERCTTIINAELLAVLTIPLFASLMARGVLYVNDFPWAIGAVLYAVSLGGAGYKYIKEALDMMEEEGALVPITDESKE